MTNNDVTAIRDSARDLIRRTDPIARLRRRYDGAAGIDRAVWAEFVRAGWLATLVPEQQGGLGLGLNEIAPIAEEIGASLAPEPFVACGVQSIATLIELDDSPIKPQLLADMGTGKKIAGVAWQEFAGQLDADQLDTRAALQGSRGTLNGRKQFVPGDCDGWIVSARAGDALALFWVDAKLPGVRFAPIERVDGQPMGVLSLTDVAINPETFLGAGDTALGALQFGIEAARLAQSAELVGVARRALSLTLEFVKTRTQFDKPIGSFQALQHRLVDAYVQSELAAIAVSDALAEMHAGRLSPVAAASRAKARAAHAATHASRLAIQLHGAIGTTHELDIGLYYKRALGQSSWLGTVRSHRRRYFAMRPEANSVPSETARTTEFPRDADWDAMPDATFRAMLRSFFAEHYPAHLRFRPNRVRWAEIRDWYGVLVRQGWVAPAWPKEHGGMGLAPDKQIAFIEESEQYGVARAPDQGIVMVGPLLMRFGTPAQRAEYLPKILTGEYLWCQGYSEPNAGSDLASLRTEAVADGDAFIVTGQKIWTTLAQDSTHIFMLARTDKSAKKQAGISFLLVDLATPGITIRPIKRVTGDDEFCEVFFDRVRVPRANLVGELNQGWTIAKALLGFERLFIGSPKQAQYALTQTELVATRRGLFEDTAFVTKFAEVLLDVADLSGAYGYYAELVKRGEALPDSVSMLKLWATETQDRISALLIEAADEHGGTMGEAQFLIGAGAPVTNDGINILGPQLNALGATIYSGTNEIQRNILARQVLRLPS